MLDWDQVYHRRQFMWAGKVARLAAKDPERLTYQVLVHRNWEWIKNVSVKNNGSQLHGRRLRIWRWERPLYKYHGEIPWELVAQNEEMWAQQLDKMVRWRTASR